MQKKPTKAGTRKFKTQRNQRIAWEERARSYITKDYSKTILYQKIADRVRGKLK